MSFGWIAQGINQALDDIDARHRQKAIDDRAAATEERLANAFEYQKSLRKTPEQITAERNLQALNTQYQTGQTEGNITALPAQQEQQKLKTQLGTLQAQGDINLYPQRQQLALTQLGNQQVAANVEGAIPEAEQIARARQQFATQGVEADTDAINAVVNKEQATFNQSIQSDKNKVLLDKLKSEGLGAAYDKATKAYNHMMRAAYSGDWETLQEFYNDQTIFPDGNTVNFVPTGDGRVQVLAEDMEGPVVMSPQQVVELLNKSMDPKAYLEQMQSAKTKAAERAHEINKIVVEESLKAATKTQEQVIAEAKAVSTRINDALRNEEFAFGENTTAATHMKEVGRSLVEQTRGRLNADAATRIVYKEFKDLPANPTQEQIDVARSRVEAEAKSYGLPIRLSAEVDVGIPEVASAEERERYINEAISYGATKSQAEEAANKTFGPAQEEPAEVRKADRKKYETEAERRARIRKENSQAINNPQRGKSDTSPVASQSKSPPSPVRKGSIADAVVEHAPSTAKAAYKDVAQAASAILGAPIDLSNDILNAIGIEIDKPYGGYKSWIDLFNKALDEGDKVKYIDRWKTHGGAGKSVKSAAPALGIDAFGAL